MKTDLILLTNDDGAHARGLLSLREALQPLGKVVVVAPSEEQSGVGHGLTIRKPLRVTELAKDLYSLTGTPVDCVIFAVRKLLGEAPGLVISGINHGANLGDDVHYSGTVAAAREAAFYGIPSIAASLVCQSSSPSFQWASLLVRELVGELYPDRIPEGTYLNVNIPEGKPVNYRFTRQGSRRVTTTITESSGKRGRKHYWIDQDRSEWVIEADTDYFAIREGAVSVTPMHRDHTDYRSLIFFSQEDEREESSGRGAEPQSEEKRNEEQSKARN